MAFSLAPRHAPVERDEDEAPEVGAARPVGRRGGLRVAPALLDLGAERWRGALRELEGLGASSGRAIALGVGAAAVVVGGRAARSVPPPAARHFVS
jgi:hypothetical protein